MCPMRRHLLHLALFLLACDGAISRPLPGRIPDGANEGGGFGFVASIECHDDALPLEEPMHRLSRVQYENTLRDVLTTFVGPARALALVTQALQHASLLPGDVAPIDPDNRFRTLYRRWSDDV